LSLIPLIKKRLTTLPFPVGSLLARFPYQHIPVVGKVYQQRLQEIEWFSTAPLEQQQQFVFDRMVKLVAHAAANIEFYRRHYANDGFEVGDLKDFDSIKQIPLVSKKDLQKFELSDRSSSQSGNRFLANTGGSTGTPLSFYVQDDAVGHERAHLQKVWSRLGFSSSNYTLTFSGRSKFKSRPIEYDSARHCFNVNIYEDFGSICNELRRLFRKRTFRFLHGYPSAIHEFALHCGSNAVDVRDHLRNTLKGILLSSEFPQRVWRENIETTFGAPTLSFYGHTERCVMAYESERQYEYSVLQSYGYAEAVETNIGTEFVGTAYYNYACPMIRYRTGDQIGEIQSEGELLKSFQVTSGREGDFVLDSNGKKIPLTGLIFGRHHELFDVCSHLQVSQSEKGKVTIHYCPIPKMESEITPHTMFDSSNVSLEFTFVAIAEPIKTKAGKIRLLVPTPSTPFPATPFPAISFPAIPLPVSNSFSAGST